MWGSEELDPFYQWIIDSGIAKSIQILAFDDPPFEAETKNIIRHLVQAAGHRLEDLSLHEVEWAELGQNTGLHRLQLVYFSVSGAFRTLSTVSSEHLASIEWTISRKEWDIFISDQTLNDLDSILSGKTFAQLQKCKIIADRWGAFLERKQINLVLARSIHQRLPKLRNKLGSDNLVIIVHERSQ